MSGSSDDPKSIPGLKGESWEKGLINYGIESKPCYVMNYPPSDESSHPDFSVGGHMTQIKSGKVPYGDISYLMPLYYWHNNTSRNHKPFELLETSVVELSGYMQ